MNILDTSDGTLNKFVESALVAQEHRFTHILWNIWRSWQFPKDDPRRTASWRALIWAVVSPTRSAIIGTGIISIVSLFVAYRANAILGDQNRLIEGQSALLRSQNELIERESHLAEASRRAGLIYELTSILDEIDEELDIQEASGSPNPTSVPASHWSDAPEVTISDRLTGRIVALSRSLRPYRYLEPESGKLTEAAHPLSPERAQLLVSLVVSRIDLTQMTVRGIDLSRSDLRFANLMGGDLRNLQMPQCDLSHANLSACKLINASFAGSNLQFANFSGTELMDVTLEGCDLGYADFRDIADIEWCFDEIKKSKNWDKAVYDQQVAAKLGISKSQLEANHTIRDRAGA